MIPNYDALFCVTDTFMESYDGIVASQTNPVVIYCIEGWTKLIKELISCIVPV